MLYLYKGEISYKELLNMTWKEIGYLKDFRMERKKKNGGADEAADALASALTGGGR